MSQQCSCLDAAVFCLFFILLQLFSLQSRTYCRPMCKNLDMAHTKVFSCELFIFWEVFFNMTVNAKEQVHNTFSSNLLQELVQASVMVLWRDRLTRHKYSDPFFKDT